MGTKFCSFQFEKIGFPRNQLDPSWTKWRSIYSVSISATPARSWNAACWLKGFFFGLLKLNYIGFVFSEYLFDGEFLLRPPQAFHIPWNDPHEETSCTLALQVIKFCTSYLFFCIKSGSISASAIQSPLGFHRSCGVNLFLLKYTYLIGVGKCSISLFGTMLTFSATSRSGVSISAKLLNCAWL